MATNDKDTFSKNSSYYLELYTSLYSQSTNGNFSTVYYRLRVYKTAGYGYYASNGVSNKGVLSSSEGTLWSDPSFSFDYRNGSNTGYWTYASGYVVVPHRTDGTGDFYMVATMELYNLGSARVATGTVGLPALADVPNAPIPVNIEPLDTDRVLYQVKSGGDGGSKIIEYQIVYSKNSSISAGGYKTWVSDGSTEVYGLDRATTYYFWARARNAVGWGPYSIRWSTKTLADTPNAPKVIGTSEITQTTMKYQFQAVDNGGAPMTEFEIGYGVRSDVPQIFIKSTGISTLVNLHPGTTYYIWSRGLNSVGWSAWSKRISATTVAGAKVKVSGVWKDAIPYVNVEGVWRLAQPYVNVNGTWKKTD